MTPRPSPRLLQLYAIRASIEALVAAEESELFGANGNCPHPEEKRRDKTTMGGEPKYVCLQCGETVAGVM